MRTVIKLSVQDVNRRKHALFPNRHGCIVKSCLIALQISLAQMSLTLHQVGLDGWDVIQFLQLDAIIDHWTAE